jgi:hypothetical protein
MRYKLGRALQLVGMTLLPIAMAGEMMNRLDLKEMLALTGGGALVFFIGWLLQQSSKPQ